MAISIAWGTRVISIPKADLIHNGGLEYELDVNAFRLELKDNEDDEVGMPYPDTHNHNTVVVLGGIPYARSIEIINGYTVTFEAGIYSVTLTGANNNIQDVTNLNTVSVRSTNSAGLVEIPSSGLTAEEQAIMLKMDILYKTFLNRAVTVENGDGTKTISFYDDDSLTILDQLDISADGNERTNP